MIHPSWFCFLEIWEEWDALPTTVWIRRDPLSLFFGNDGLENGIFSFQKDVYFWPSISNFSKNSPKKSIQQKIPTLKISITTISNKIQQTFPPKLNTHPSPQKNIPGILPGRASLCIVARCRCRRGSWQKLKMARGMKQWNWLSQWLPSMKLTYPTWGSLENHRLKYAENQGDMLIPWRVTLSNFCGIKMRLVRWVIKPNLSYPPGNDHISYHILFSVGTFELMMFLFLRWDTSLPWEGNLHLWSKLTEWVNDYLPAFHGGYFSHFVVWGGGNPEAKYEVGTKITGWMKVNRCCYF